MMLREICAALSWNSVTNSRNLPLGARMLARRPELSVELSVTDVYVEPAGSTIRAPNAPWMIDDSLAQFMNMLVPSSRSAQNLYVKLWPGATLESGSNPTAAPNDPCGSNGSLPRLKPARVALSFLSVMLTQSPGLARIPSGTVGSVPALIAASSLLSA